MAVEQRPIRVIIAEDNDSHARLVERLLELQPQEFCLARVCDGEALLHLLLQRKQGGGSAAEPPDIVLLDLRLPRIDGLEALRLMKSHLELREIPVAVLTTSASEEDRARAEQLKADHYLTKPLDQRGLTQLLTDLGLSPDASPTQASS